MCIVLLPSSWWWHRGSAKHSRSKRCSVLVALRLAGNRRCCKPHTLTLLRRIAVARVTVCLHTKQQTLLRSSGINAAMHQCMQFY